MFCYICLIRNLISESSCITKRVQCHRFASYRLYYPAIRLYHQPFPFCKYSIKIVTYTYICIYIYIHTPDRFSKSFFSKTRTCYFRFSLLGKIVSRPIVKYYSLCNISYFKFPLIRTNLFRQDIKDREQETYRY